MNGVGFAHLFEGLQFVDYPFLVSSLNIHQDKGDDFPLHLRIFLLFMRFHLLPELLHVFRYQLVYADAVLP